MRQAVGRLTFEVSVMVLQSLRIFRLYSSFVRHYTIEIHDTWKCQTDFPS